MKRLAHIVLAAVALAATSDPAPAQTAARTTPQTTHRAAFLVYSETAGFRHDSIPAGVSMLLELAREEGWSADHSEDSSVFADDVLASYDAVVFLSTTGDVLTPAEERAFERFIANGGGFVGIHAAADTEYDWAWYGELVGAYFRDHPPVQTAVVEVADSTHPSTQALPHRWERVDEWYNYRHNPRPDVRVLLTLDETSYEGGGHGSDHPIAWCRELDGGRAWYTGLGHTDASFRDPLFIAHVRGGLSWALGLEDGDCVPAQR